MDGMRVDASRSTVGRGGGTCQPRAAHPTSEPARTSTRKHTHKHTHTQGIQSTKGTRKADARQTHTRYKVHTKATCAEEPWRPKNSERADMGHDAARNLRRGKRPVSGKHVGQRRATDAASTSTVHRWESGGIQPGWSCGIGVAAVCLFVCFGGTHPGLRAEGRKRRQELRTRLVALALW